MEDITPRDLRLFIVESNLSKVYLQQLSVGKSTQLMSTLVRRLNDRRLLPETLWGGVYSNSRIVKTLEGMMEDPSVRGNLPWDTFHKTTLDFIRINLRLLELELEKAKGFGRLTVEEIEKPLQTLNLPLEVVGLRVLKPRT
ncbi:MAG: hypothetical protein FJY77_02115 [Candidatus Altiarchaeales archaeon]|nr:hypothetical protein [Candidatus Altiarchaeales archaeon]